MRIILLINSLSTGGAEFSTLLYYEWLKQTTDFKIKIVCLKVGEPVYNHKEFGFEKIDYLKSGSFYGRFKEFNKIIHSFKPDLVHSVLFEANLIGRFSRLFKRNFKHIESLVNQTYSPFRLKDPNVNKTKLTFYRILDLASQYYGVDHFHSNGNTVAEHYHTKLFINKDRITNIPRGRTANKYLNDDKNKFDIRHTLKIQDKIVLINVARHEYQKAQTILLEAMGKLNKKFSKNNIVLLLVGREGNATNEIKSLIAKLSLQEKVLVLGHRTDVPALLAASDIFVFPSRFEGLPGALIEAQAAGLPIICSEIPNNLEVVKKNENALTFKVDDYVQLSRCIVRLSNDWDKRDEMRDKNLRRFFENYEIEKVHQRMLKLFQKIIKD